MLSEEINAGSITVNGASVTVSISRVGQRAYLTFDGNSGQQITVRLTSNSMGSVTVSLLKPDGTQLTSSTSSASSFNLTTQTLPTTGTYTILVDPAGTNTGSMNVAVTNP
jgi:lipid-binding SYLF domain-containing protein